MSLYAVLAIGAVLLATIVPFLVRAKRNPHGARKTDEARARRRRALYTDVGRDMIWEFGRCKRLSLGTGDTTCPDLSRRHFFRGLAMGMLSFAVGWIAARGLALRSLNSWLTTLPDRKTSSPYLTATRSSEAYKLALGHTDTPHTDTHTDSPATHIDVTEPCDDPPCPHVDTTRPHIDSHFDTPHVDQDGMKNKVGPEQDTQVRAT